MSVTPPPVHIDWTQIPEVMTVEEAGAILRVSPATAYRGVHSGTIPAIKVSGRLRVPKGRLMTLLGYEAKATSA